MTIRMRCQRLLQGGTKALCDTPKSNKELADNGLTPYCHDGTRDENRKCPPFIHYLRHFLQNHHKVAYLQDIILFF